MPAGPRRFPGVSILLRGLAGAFSMGPLAPHSYVYEHADGDFRLIFGFPWQQQQVPQQPAQPLIHKVSV